MNRPKVSVIIAIYNIEKYFKRSLFSLFNQNLKEIEYIFIDDGSTDSSLNVFEEVLKLFPQRQAQVKLIKHKKNLGVAAARADGIKAATGEFIIHCDPDDYIDKEMYESMYNYAVKYNFDIVSCDFLIEKEHKNEIISFYPDKCAQKYLKNGIKTGLAYASSVNKLVKASIIKNYNILPYEKCDYGEDLGFILRILYYAESIGHINKAYYHYCKRNDSITGKPLTQEEFNSLMLLSQNITQFFQEKGFESVSNCFKFQLKIKGRHFYKGKEKEWISLFKECRKDIFKFSDNSLKARIIWWLSMQNIFFYKTLERFLQ